MRWNMNVLYSWKCQAATVVVVLVAMLGPANASAEVVTLESLEDLALQNQARWEAMEARSAQAGADVDAARAGQEADVLDEHLGRRCSGFGYRASPNNRRSRSQCQGVTDGWRAHGVSPQHSLRRHDRHARTSLRWPNQGGDQGGRSLSSGGASKLRRIARDRACHGARVVPRLDRQPFGARARGNFRTRDEDSAGAHRSTGCRWGSSRLGPRYRTVRGASGRARRGGCARESGRCQASLGIRGGYRAASRCRARCASPGNRSEGFWFRRWVGGRGSRTSARRSASGGPDAPQGANARARGHRPDGACGHQRAGISDVSSGPQPRGAPVGRR